ncbi:MAG: DUF6209 family protein [Kofleriaceae bacterium]|nr:DUF6209 family protein [Kofleriaceae bacterium]
MARTAFALHVSLVISCAAGGDQAEVTTAPLVGVDGSKDQADRSCHVVMRQLARAGSSFTWETEGSSWVWSGSVEISEAAANEGLVPAVMYRMAPSGPWTTVQATASSAPATLGYARFDVRLHQGLPGPGWSGTTLTNARIEVVPYLALPEGGRLFDHNRHRSDFENYLLASPNLALPGDASVCSTPTSASRARLVFAADFSERREGVLVPGGEVTIAYDGARLTQCRNSRNGTPLYDITAHVRFAPSGEERLVSVRDSSPALAVPTDARSVTLWFENTAIPGCQAWDSNFGANYTFETLRAPQWIGEARSLITRDTSDRCDGGVPAQTGFSFDTWARQRAATSNVCFQVYEPGVTDRDDPALWQKLDAQLHYKFVGATSSEWRRSPVAFDRRRGNNARYAFDWRALDPLRSYHCPEVTPAITAQPDGNRAEVRLEYYVTVNGSELRPEPGAAFAGVFVDDADSTWRAANCP